MEEFGAWGKLLFSLFSKRRRRISPYLDKYRLVEHAQSGLEQEQQELENFQKQP